MELLEERRVVTNQALQQFKMAIQITLENIAKTLMQQITEVIATVAPRHNVADSAALTQDILVGLGLVDLKIDPVAAAAAAAKPVKPKAAPKPRKKKTETIEVPAPAAPTGPAAPPSSPALPPLVRDEDAPPPLPAPAEPAGDIMKELDEVLEEKKEEKKEEKPKKPRAKKEKVEKKKGRMDKWTAASTKVFKTIVEEEGSTLTDALKTEFVTWLDSLTEEDFAATSIQGHMRAFVTKPAGAGAAPAAPTVPVEELEAVD